MSEKEQATHWWQTFRAAPAETLAQVSLVFFTLGPVAAGACTVEGSTLSEKQPVAPPNKLENTFAARTKVFALKVTAGGDGTTYWYPYVERGVGTCDVPHAAATGTIALTAGMNGCSLRIYQNIATGDLRFCHDNNGKYVDHNALTAAGFRHLLSVNAEARTRGLPAENINDYWVADFQAHPYSGVFFICVKSGAAEWKVYLSAAVADFANRIEKEHWYSTTTYTVFTNHYSGAQQHNRLVATLAIPAPAPPVVAAPAPVG
jgi:hypothetical protein